MPDWVSMVTEWRNRTPDSKFNILTEGKTNFINSIRYVECVKNPQEEIDNFKNLVYTYESMFVYNLPLI